MELSPAQADNLQLEFDKVARLLDTPKGEAQAHVILSHERHLNHAEVTVSYHHHEMVGQAAEVDLFAAIHAAVAKLEAQLASPEFFKTQGARANSVITELETLKEKTVKLYARWEELEAVRAQSA